MDNGSRTVASAGRLSDMEAVPALERLGGVATGTELLVLTSRKRLRTAVSRGHIDRVSRNHYALRDVESGRAAARLHGVRSHLSAAIHHGWAVKAPPVHPEVTVRRGRRIDRNRRVGVALHRRDLPAEDVEGLATAPLRTVLDCAKGLPFDEALAVADSALRAGDVTRAQLFRATAGLRGRNAARARRVAAHADGRAANPFESVLRALAIEAGLDVVPQQPVESRLGVRYPDLVDRERRLILEADSWEFHGEREAFDRDCRRYNAFVTARWWVLRFVWADVMRHQDDVLAVLREFAEPGPPGHPDEPTVSGRAA